WNGNYYGGPALYLVTGLAPVSNVALFGAGQSQLSQDPLILSEPVASAQAWWIEEVEFPVGFWPRRTVPVEASPGQGSLFILNVDSGHLPQAVTGLAAGAQPVMNVIYACGHQLDANGCSILDQDSDVIAVGACYYACRSQVQTADNFHFQDGEMRDQ